MMWDRGGGWWWLFGTLMMLGWIALVGLAIWWVVRTTQGRQPEPFERAKEILAERYARGELTTDEYRDRVDALR